MGRFFIYQALSEKLYKSGLSEEEANVEFENLDRILEVNGINDQACKGCLDRRDDFYVAQRLGLIDGSFADYDDYQATYEEFYAGRALRREHDMVYGY